MSGLFASELFMESPIQWDNVHASLSLHELPTLLAACAAHLAHWAPKCTSAGQTARRPAEQLGCQGCGAATTRSVLPCWRYVGLAGAAGARVPEQGGGQEGCLLEAMPAAPGGRCPPAKQ